MASANIIQLTAADFNDVVTASDVPVMVDFWAAWCGPCKMIMPIMDQLADEYQGKAKVCKVNVDEESELAVKFGIMTIPTVVVFKNGEMVDKNVGVSSKDYFAKMIEKAL